MSTEDFHALQKSDLLAPSNDSRFDLGELFLGVVDGALTKPARAIKQLVSDSHNASASQPPCETDKIKNSALQEKPSDCRKTGEVVGALVPFVTLVGLTRGASTELLGEYYNPSMAMIMGEQASAGFIMGSLLTPSDLKPGEDLLAARLSQGKSSAATFATLTGTSESLDQNLPKSELETSAVDKLARKITVSVLSGTVSGFTDFYGKTSLGASSADGISALMTQTAMNKFALGTDKLVDLVIHSDSDKTETGKVAAVSDKTAK